MIELGQQAKENEEKEEEGVRSPSRQESGLERFGPADVSVPTFCSAPLERE